MQMMQKSLFIVKKKARCGFEIHLVDRAPLTEKQQNVYESIMQYQRVNGYAPTIREICKMVGVASTSSVYAHLKILEEKGYIARKMDASRAIAIL